MNISKIHPISLIVLYSTSSSWSARSHRFLAFFLTPDKIILTTRNRPFSSLKITSARIYDNIYYTLSAMYVVRCRPSNYLQNPRISMILMNIRIDVINRNPHIKGTARFQWCLKYYDLSIRGLISPNLKLAYASYLRLTSYD